jgi:hypothetical protein
MINTATPSVTPRTEISVMTDTKERFGRRYRNASNSSKGKRDIRGSLGNRNTACQRTHGITESQAGFSHPDQPGALG